MGGEALPSCGDARIDEHFTFEEVGLVVNGSAIDEKLHWVKGAYDSTDVATGSIDLTANPPANATNLANLSTLAVLPRYGDPAPGMSFTIPFSAAPPKPEVVQLLYVFASYGEPENTVDLSRATLKARARLAQVPNESCTVSMHAWTTSTNAPGTTYAHVDGPSVNLTQEWMTVTMDLAISASASAINQYGFGLRSACTDAGPPVDGSAGAPGEETKTVVLIDTIETTCE